MFMFVCCQNRLLFFFLFDYLIRIIQFSPSSSHNNRSSSKVNCSCDSVRYDEKGVSLQSCDKLLYLDLPEKPPCETVKSFLAIFKFFPLNNSRCNGTTATDMLLKRKQIQTQMASVAAHTQRITSIINKY